MFRKTDSGKNFYLPLGELMEFGFTIKDESKIGAMQTRDRIFSLIGISIMMIIFYSALRDVNDVFTVSWSLRALSIPFIMVFVYCIIILNPSNVMTYSRERDGKLQFKIRSNS